MQYKRPSTFAFFALSISWCSFVILVTSALLQPAGYAGLVNQDTGEVYIPALDENGDLEEPPEWVIENLNNTVYRGSDVAVYSDLIETEDDICQAPISAILTDQGPEPVHGSIDDADIYAELINDLETILSIPVLSANHGANVLTDVVKFFHVTIDSFDCNAPEDINSFVTFTIPIKVFGLSNGEVVIDGSLQLREDDDGYDRFCLEVSDIETINVWPLGGIIENFVLDLYAHCI